MIFTSMLSARVTFATSIHRIDNEKIHQSLDKKVSMLHLDTGQFNKIHLEQLIDDYESNLKVTSIGQTNPKSIQYDYCNNKYWETRNFVGNQYEDYVVPLDKAYQVCTGTVLENKEMKDKGNYKFLILHFVLFPKGMLLFQIHIRNYVSVTLFCLMDAMRSYGDCELSYRGCAFSPLNGTNINGMFDKRHILLHQLWTNLLWGVKESIKPKVFSHAKRSLKHDVRLRYTSQKMPKYPIVDTVPLHTKHYTHVLRVQVLYCTYSKAGTLLYRNKALFYFTATVRYSTVQ